MASKTIKINPDLFTLGKKKGGKSGKQKTLKNKLDIEDKKTLSSFMKPNKMKKELLRLIRDKQKRDKENTKNEDINNESKMENTNDKNNKFTNEFKQSMDYIQKLIERKKQQKTLKHKDKIKDYNKNNNSINTNRTKETSFNNIINPPLIGGNIHINTDSIDIIPKKENYIKPNLISYDNNTNIKFSSDNLTNKNNSENNTQQISTVRDKVEPPYGCLKGGKKPTFKQYNKTIKKNIIHDKIEDIISEKPKINILSQDTSKNKDINTQKELVPVIHTDNNILERKEKLKSIKQGRDINQTRHNESITPRFRTYKKKTIKTNYKLGKYKDKNKIGVLIKNNITRKKIRDATDILKKTPIVKIKKYLREKNMLKFGSYAPDNILKQIFIQCMLSGDITNKSSDVLIHNYFNE